MSDYLDDVTFTKEQSQRMFELLLSIANGTALEQCFNDSSSTYFQVSNIADVLIEELFIEWNKPFYKLEHLKIANSTVWAVVRVVDGQIWFHSEDKEVALRELAEYNADFVGEG